jgi:hypothetical protein
MESNNLIIEDIDLDGYPGIAKLKITIDNDDIIIFWTENWDNEMFSDKIIINNIETSVIHSRYYENNFKSVDSEITDKKCTVETLRHIMSYLKERTANQSMATFVMNDMILKIETKNQQDI